MINPTAGSAEMSPTSSTRKWFLYYLVCLIMAGANFLPLLVDTPLRARTPPQRTIYYLIICFILSLPLMFEFFLDVVVSQLSTSAKKLSEPKAGYFMIVLALFLPVCTISGPIEDARSHCGVLFINCFISFLLSLIVVGLYDKLQFRTKGHWQLLGCLSTVFFFIASQVLLNLGVAFGPVEDEDYKFHLKTPRVRWCLGMAFASGIAAFLLTSFFSKRYIISMWKKASLSVLGSIDDYVAVVLQCIASVYFIVNSTTILVYLVDRWDFDHYLNVFVISLIVLGLCAAILPGRVVRKKFMLLNDALAIKETFIRYISHEIRSPLSTTSLGLNYLLDKLNNEDIKPSEMLDVVKESVVTCELAMNTLNDFLMLDKIQNNMLEISPVARQASEFMMEAVRPFSLQASSSNVTLMCNVESFDGNAARDVSVDMDSYKMNQVLRNLLSNAFKFTPSGGAITATMTIHEYTTEELVRAGLINGPTLAHCVDGHCNTVRFSVKDSGCGISAENLPRLFGQYVQFDAAKLQGGKGSGLGLWLSKAIVEMHGGRIGARSEGEGKGCTFWFELPCELSEEDRLVARLHKEPNAFVQKTFSLGTPEHTVSMGRRSIVDSTFTVRSADDMQVIDLERGETHTSELQGSVITTSGGMAGGYFPVPKNEKVTALQRLPSSRTNPAATVNTPSRRKFVDLIASFSNSRGALRYRTNSTDSFRLSPLRVLLVDDSAITRKMVERSLASIGAVCSHAHNGKIAIEKVQQAQNSEDTNFDVIVMDNFMPEMSGPEAVVVIRDRLQYKGVIMGVSGNASTDTEFETLLSVGTINAVMVKPFNLDMFVSYMKNQQQLSCISHDPDDHLSGGGVGSSGCGDVSVFTPEGGEV